MMLMLGDCLERMKEIPDGSVDMVLADPIKTTDESIVEMYINGMSMRSIARKINTNHKVVSKVLKNSGVATREPKSLRGIRKFDSHKEKMYNNMATHIRFNVSVDWLMQFKDFEKLKTLNDVITNRSGRWDVSTEWYKEYIPKFYNDKNFNLLYNLWIINGREK